MLVDISGDARCDHSESVPATERAISFSPIRTVSAAYTDSAA